MNQISLPIQPQRARVALLIDGENLSSAHAGALILTSASYGALTVKRVYGNVARLNGWCAAPGFRVMHSGTGKNATDLLLTVEAMALMLLNQADILVLGSSDGDFTHVAQHLTERGQTVIGIGLDTVPDKFRKSCTSFHCLPPPAAPLAPLVVQTRSLLVHDPQGMPITLLSTAMKTTHQIQIAQTPHKTWRAFLMAHPDQFDLDPKGPTARVRLKP
ncbi:MAG: NYN domain-containing protein [Candidatus Saccharibacteria bacterium]|nr:NYN domain-containing protein [Pseudorhodobacter sp.]